MYVCDKTKSSSSVFVHKHTQTHADMHTHTHACTHAHMHVKKIILSTENYSECMCVTKQNLVVQFLYTNTHRHMQTCTHTHMHAHTHTCMFANCFVKNILSTENYSECMCVKKNNLVVQFLYTNTHRHMQTCTHTHTCMHTCTHACLQFFLLFLNHLEYWKLQYSRKCFKTRYNYHIWTKLKVSVDQMYHYEVPGSCYNKCAHNLFWQLLL